MDLVHDNDDCDDDKRDDNPVVSAVLKRGDVLLYDYRICHRGTSNLSISGSSSVAAATDDDVDDRCDDDGNNKGILRKVLYLMYARPWFREHLNFGKTSLFE